MNRRWAGALAALSAASIWGGTFVVSKLVLDVVPPVTLIVLRFCIALPILLVWYRSSGGQWLRRDDVLSLAVTGLVGFCISLGTQFGGTKLSTASNGALITSATPAFIVPFALLLLREHSSALQLAGLALATAGVVVVVDPRAFHIEASVTSILGNGLLVVAALTWALYSVLVKRATNRGHSALAVTLYATMWGIVFNLPLAAVELGDAHIGMVTAGDVLGILYIGVLATALAFYLWNRGFELLDANTAALCFFAQPVVGVLLGFLLLHEPIGLPFMLGGVLILFGAIISQIHAPRALKPVEQTRSPGR